MGVSVSDGVTEGEDVMDCVGDNVIEGVVEDVWVGVSVSDGVTENEDVTDCVAYKEEVGEVDLLLDPVLEEDGSATKS